MKGKLLSSRKLLLGFRVQATPQYRRTASSDALLHNKQHDSNNKKEKHMYSIVIIMIGS